MHWGGVGALQRNPYPSYAYPRIHPNNLQQTSNEDSPSNSSVNDDNKGRKMNYEDKMDKQRLEHILFSGEHGGPLNVMYSVFYF